MIGDIFNTAIIAPMINFLVLLNNVLFGNFGLAIIAFTIVMRLITFPLTLRQLRSTRAMQDLNPRIQEINKKYSDPKRRQQEIMGLYRESGVSPLGCLGPMVLQFPILIGLFYAIRQTLPESPEALENLSTHLYSWSYLQHAVPLGTHFLGLDLRHPNIIMVGLVALTTLAQSKTTVSVATDERAKAQQQMMNIMLPLMFGFFALSFPSGVSLYWVVNSLVAVVFNIAIYGLPIANIKPLFAHPTKGPKGPSGPVPSLEHPTAELASELRTTNGPGRSKRQNRRRRL